MCNTLPSAVTAANTVDEYGAQATSPTELFKSKVKRGFLQSKIHTGILIFINTFTISYSLYKKKLKHPPPPTHEMLLNINL